MWRGLAAKLSYNVGSFPSKYLGLPLRGPHKSVGAWDSVKERFRKRMASWKRQYISKSGRTTLIRSTLSSVLVYYLSLFRVPKVVCERLKRIQREFLWGGGNLEKKPHLVNWKIICIEKKKGGLGVRSLSLLNKTLLCKWSCRFANERHSLWRTVIGTKFREVEEGWRIGFHCLILSLKSPLYTSFHRFRPQ